MRISDVLRGKGSDVVTITGSAPVSDLVTLLKDKGIGAVVVVDHDTTIAGIVSERDIVRRLADGAEGLLDGPISGLMTTQVHTCAADDDLHDVAAKMTEQRIRHLPVVDEQGRLASIVSIGDVVKARLGQLEAERDALEGYIRS